MTLTFKFLYPEWREIEPAAWLAFWAARYNGRDNDVHHELMQKHGALSAGDFDLIGRWKEGCLKNAGRWKSGTPAVRPPCYTSSAAANIPSSIQGWPAPCLAWARRLPRELTVT